MTTVLGCNLRLSDVHATAETVGREFKELTDKFGMQCIMGLVPPVVDALERLEVYVESYQHLQTRLSELQMDNDTVAYERERKAKLAEENQNLTEVIRELQRENKRLLIEMDELHFKNEEMSAELRNLRASHKELDLDIEDQSSESTPMLSPLHPPHSPHRVVHLSQSHPSPPGSCSPTFTPSPSPTIPIPTSPSPPLTPSVNGSSHSPPFPPSHNHTTLIPPSPHTHNHTPHTHSSPPPHNLTPHTPPLPPSHRHHPSPTRYTFTPPATRARRVLQTLDRSSSVSDIVGVRVQPLSPLTLEEQQDMCERSRVTRKLSAVEGELEMATQRLRESQKSRERIEDENKELKTRLERFKAEASLKKFDESKRELQKVKETPRYYKEEMMRVLTERNRLKESLLALQEELTSVQEALRKVTAASCQTEVRTRTDTSVRSILTESISLDCYVPPVPPSHTKQPPKMALPHIRRLHNALHK